MKRLYRSTYEVRCERVRSIRMGGWVTEAVVDVDAFGDTEVPIVERHD